MDQNHFQSYLSQPLFSPPDDLSFADCELYPSEGEVEVDPYTRTRTSHLRQHLSEIEDSTKGYYLAPSYAAPSSFHGGASVVAGSNEPFPDYHIASCFKEISTLKPLPAHSGNGAGGAHSDALASPWTAHLSSPPALDSPCSSSNWGNIGCYTSPPHYSSDELMIPPVDEYEYPSPGGLAAVAPRQVQIEPDHQSMEGEVPMESQTIPLPLLDCLNDESEPEAVIPTSLPIDGDIPPVEPGLQARSPKPPPSKPKRSSTDGVHKPKRGLLHRQQRHTRIPSHMQTPPAPMSAPPKSPGKPPAAAAARSRVFTCSFARYGCDSTFGSKNEWKRHVASQHLQLGFYRCDVDKCNIHHKGPNQHNRQHHKKSRSHLSNDAACRIANDFNRKDLFTQHLRRMHAPWVQDGRTIEPRLPLNREREAFERSLNDIRERCWHQQRKPPQRSQCGFCAQKFRGEHSWDERMEHVGRHYERDEQPDVEMEDVGLRQWAVQEGIVRPVEEGRWILSSLCE